MTSILWFILVLSILVLVHEAGHFWVARWSGMRVEEFGIGFPPRLFSWKRKDTVYSVNSIPLGGFVRIAGENGQDRGEGTFASASFTRRFAVLLAGVAMNVVLAWGLFFMAFVVGSDMVVTGADIPKGAKVSHERVELLAVGEGMPAAQAGLKAGDVWKAVDEVAIQTAEQGRALLAWQNIGATIVLHVERDGSALSIPTIVGTLPSGGAGIGVQVGDKAFVQLPFGSAAANSFAFTGEMLKAIGTGFGELVSGLVHGKGAGDVSGPVGIARMTGQVAAEGWQQLLFFSAMLSLNLAVLNVLPFPALDGGRVFLLVIELIRRRPLPVVWEQYFHAAGFALLMLLVVLVTIKDVTKLF